MRPAYRSLLGGFALAGAVLLAQLLSARAEVIEAGPNGFALQRTIHIAATPERVYAALIQPAKWWNSDHTFSGSATNLSLDARAGGCFCEIWSGGSVQPGTIVNAVPGKVLRMRGALGPFQAQGMSGALTFSIKAAGDGADLTMENVVGGFIKGGIGKWPALADSMLAEQMIRLKRYLETGSPDPAPK
ncbi:MAG TPA: SRPBCC domain-containing protein [Rhizomicrobium sp.]|jgi:uncharacterized protein YndB with AHSA1/START domain|nr:SRPBCC domain-containing protein [Rhizomicrobium sp.]